MAKSGTGILPRESPLTSQGPAPPPNARNALALRREGCETFPMLEDSPKTTTQPAATATGAQTPIELDGTKQREPFKVAAGLKAIEETLEYGVRHSGLFNTAA